MDRSDGKHVCMLPKTPTCSAVRPTASKHPYLLCRVRQLALPCARHTGAAAVVRSRARLAAERARVRGAAVHPYSPAAFAWECAHTLVTITIFFYVPFQVFVNCPNPYDPFILFSDLMSLINILFSFAIGYVDEESKLIVLEPRLIARHYLRTTFLPDLIGTLPLQVIHLFDQCSYPSHTTMLILKLFRLMSFNKAWMIILNQMGLSYVQTRVITVMLKVLLFFHWMTFIHYQVPCFTAHYFADEDRYKVWLKRFGLVNLKNRSIFHKYAANLFLVCGLCIGAGYYSPVDEHIISELLLTSAIGLIGMFFLIYSFSVILHLAIYRQYEVNTFMGRSRELKEYMELKRLPKFLQRKINLFINYKYNGHYFNEQMIMNTINEQIKQDINMYACKKMVMAVPLFQDMPIALINVIIFNLTQVLYMPGELLVKYGQPGTTLYMISSGTVAVMSATGREMAHLRDGAYFGETALLRPGSTRIATIIALEITEVYKLDNEDFLVCLQPYPHLKRRLEESYLKRKVSSRTYASRSSYPPV